MPWTVLVFVNCLSCERSALLKAPRLEMFFPRIVNTCGELIGQWAEASKDSNSEGVELVSALSGLTIAVNSDILFTDSVPVIWVWAWDLESYFLRV